MNTTEVKEEKIIPDEDVIVKLGICPKCNGFVRAAVKHLMDRKSINSFAKEAMECNWSIREISLIEYRTNINWCTCIK